MREYLIYVLTFMVLVSCIQENREAGNFMLLPSPRQMEMRGNSGIDKLEKLSYFSESELDEEILPQYLEKSNEKQARIILSIDSVTMPHQEGYQLKIEDDKIEIVGNGHVGLFYGLISLTQLREDAIDQKVPLPNCLIVDYPALKYRAVHIDVKHHMERMEYYYQLMDRLASYKINGIILEIEDKLLYERQPTVASPDALSKESWHSLSEYALARNIRISPLVQGLGHASFILKHDEYKELRDDPESDWAFNPLDERTYEVQFDLYRDALDAFPHGQYLHIGGDEVHTTGRNSGQSPLELQLNWLEKVCTYADRQGRTPIFWDDMPLKHAGVYRPMFDRTIAKDQVDSIWQQNEEKLIEFIDLFPKNCIYMRWNYQTPETYGNLKAMEWFSDKGFEVMGATAGQTRWSLMPQNQSNIENIRSFALSSIDQELKGLLLTLWDDDSPHFELYGRGIAAFAEYAWAGDSKSVEEVKEVFRHRTFGHELVDSSFVFIDRLEEPVAFWKNALLESGESRNNLRKYDRPGEEAVIELPDPSQKGTWTEKHEERMNEAHRHLETVKEVELIIENALENAQRSSYTLEVYQQVNELVKFSFESLILLENYDRSSADMEEQALNAIKKLPKNFEQLRKELESVYGQARILNKPDNYILDQDHHTHNANQSLNFDWQFYPEILLIEKIKTKYL
ncbi:family 20 glycosylhydrolase [Portibacter marinus]|uniref:family 20 glycosylhydrolase n=1 Tax=Portibacter marinus TaxID=2898660 RepID=UPI001F401E51|nr:family 20 glycosylhydrolase [Portibacter marinus]